MCIQIEIPQLNKIWPLSTWTYAELDTSMVTFVEFHRVELDIPMYIFKEFLISRKTLKVKALKHCKFPKFRVNFYGLTWSYWKVKIIFFAENQSRRISCINNICNLYYFPKVFSVKICPNFNSSYSKSLKKTIKKYFEYTVNPWLEFDL